MARDPNTQILAGRKLDAYANAMFAFERLHPRWIDSCAAYLRHIFGESINSKVFLDYGFGRGNWSVAALKAGAKHVVSVDASESNVRRFRDHCRDAAITKIEIIHGNILEVPLHMEADILWIYGILPCITTPDTLLERLSKLRRNDNALALLYAFDRGSFRQVIVEAARQGCVYDSEHSFQSDSYLFTPRARLRARDDLIAPAVTWYTAADLNELASRHGLVLYRQCADFREWSGAKPSQEFAPHHFLCGFVKPATQSPLPKEPNRPNAPDFAVLKAIAEVVMTHANLEDRRKIAIGLFNSHFSSLSPDGSIDDGLIEDFLFLMYASLRLGIPDSTYQGTASTYYSAALNAIVDGPRGLAHEQILSSPLARYLATNTVRF